MAGNIIKRGDAEWERLYRAWKADGKDAGWLVTGAEQYRVIAESDENILFIPVTGNIDNMYGSYTQGVPQ